MSVLAHESRPLAILLSTESTAPWSQLGIWLSLWNARAEFEGASECPITFWDQLIQQSNRCRTRCADIVRNAMANGTTLVELDPHGGTMASAIPILWRSQVTGCVLACAITPEFLDEETFSRFCSQHQVDRTVFASLVRQIVPQPPEQLRACLDILARHVNAYSDGTRWHTDVNALSSQLAQTYEQLHLLYRVSANMLVSTRPTKCFENLFNALLGSTAIQHFAAVLNPPHLTPDNSDIVSAGSLSVEPDNILRLSQQAHHLPRNAGQVLVINDAPSRPEFAWTKPWLRHFALFDLSVSGKRFGSVLAFNLRDELEFGSEDIHLINAIVERGSAFLENAHLYDNLEQLFMGMLHALVNSIDAKDPYTCGHSQRVAWLSRHIATLANIPEHECQRVYLSGLLHDIGKIGVPEAVLSKEGRLTAEEYEEVKRHSEVGAGILQSVPQVHDLIPGVLHHHERIDGKGYPDGLAGNDIPLLGRIVGLADSFDAMTSSRTYRQAQPIPAVAAELRRCSGTQFDPYLTDLFLANDIREISRKMARSGRSATDSKRSAG